MTSLYRRCDEDRVRDEHGELTDVARAVLRPWLSGNLGLVNAFGNGVADDKLVHSHVDDFIRFYLGQEPDVPSVPTYDFSRPAGEEETKDRLREHVVKPRHGHGGTGVVIGPQATGPEIDDLADEVARRPDSYISQPTISLSFHPDRDRRSPGASPRRPARVRVLRRRRSHSCPGASAGSHSRRTS